MQWKSSIFLLMFVPRFVRICKTLTCGLWHMLLYRIRLWLYAPFTVSIIFPYAQFTTTRRALYFLILFFLPNADHHKPPNKRTFFSEIYIYFMGYLHQGCLGSLLVWPCLLQFIFLEVLTLKTLFIMEPLQIILLRR